MGNLTDSKVKEDIQVDPSNIMQVGMGFWVETYVMRLTGPTSSVHTIK